MSLLIKALAQAAKDRDAANSDRAVGPDASAGAPADPPRTASSLSLEAPAQRRAAPSLAGLAHIEAQQRSRAAAVVQAGERPTSNILAYARASPVAILGGLAVLFGIGFGVYVYLQVASPGLLSRKPPAPPQASAQAPLPAAPQSTSPATGSTPPASDSPGAGAAAFPAPAVNGAAGASSSAVTGAGAIPGAGASPAPSAPPAMSTQIPTASVIPSRDAIERSPERPVAEPVRERPAARAVDGRQSPPAAPAESAPAPRERIVVSASTQKPTINPNLNLAYSALQSGDVEQARAMYARVNQAEPLNIDALLGLAYIASRENRSDDAMKQYLRILQLDPRHALAQAGMISLMGRADPVSAESRLKQIISREPSAFLHFTLGNLYADQSMWSQAQQSYFQAHHLEPGNPDYAYNLAVGLDHLRQTKLALDYYRRAADSAASQGRANFNLSHARERIGILSSQLQ